jgi:hypothetical protein
LDPSDVIVGGISILLLFGRCDALGPSTKIQTQSTFTPNRTDKDIPPDIALQYDCCEHLGSKLKLSTVKGTSELPLKNTFCHSSAFIYSGHSVDQIGKSILQNEAELSTEHRLRQLNFLFYVGIERVTHLAVIMFFL